MTAKEILEKRATLERSIDEARTKLGDDLALPRIRVGGTLIQMTDTGTFNVDGKWFNPSDTKALYDWLGELKPWEK